MKITRKLLLRFSVNGDRNQVRRANRALNRYDEKEDLNLRLGLAMGESMVPRGPGFLRRVQEIGCNIARKLDLEGI